MKNIKLAIVGATGLVGQTILKVLEEKHLPISQYTFFASSRSCGKKLNFLGKEYIVQELTSTSFDEGFDYAIFSAGGDVAKKFAPIAAQKGCIVIDNSSYFRMDATVPLIVPEVNPEEIAHHHGIIANPNCSTIQAVVALKPLDTAFGIKRIVYSTYQAVSGGGYRGVMDLENGIEDYVRNKNNNQQNLLNGNLSLCSSHNSSATPFNYSLEKFAYPIFNNCLPHIDVFLENGYTKEEEKMINETRKILKRPQLSITATAVRVPVFTGHSEAINVEFEKDFELENLKQILKGAPGIILKDDLENEIYPTTLDVTNENCTFVRKSS